MKVTQVAHTKFTTKGCSQETKQLQSICGTTAKTELSGTEAEPRPGLYWVSWLLISDCIPGREPAKPVKAGGGKKS